MSFIWLQEPVKEEYKGQHIYNILTSDIKRTAPKMAPNVALAQHD